MSVVVNVMLSLMIDEPTSCIVQPIGAHYCEVMYFGYFGFRGELGFPNCNDICTCGREQADWAPRVCFWVRLCWPAIWYFSYFYSWVCVFVVLGLYVRLSWYPMLWVRWLWCMYCCLCCMCGCCENVRVTEMLVCGPGDVWLRWVRIWGGTRGSGALSSANYVWWRGVGGVWHVHVFLARGAVRGLGLGFPNPGRTVGKWDMCLVWFRWCWGGGECVGGLGHS